MHFCLHSGGNEESEICELQTAREWSDDEEGEGDVDVDDDDEELSSSPSIWGTPRQNSHELTFSYIAIAEAEAVGSSRHLRDLRDRRRASARGSRASLIHTDTLETLLDSLGEDWDPQAFLGGDEESERGEQGRVEVRREQHGETETITIQPLPHNLDPDTQGGVTGIQREESLRSVIQIARRPSAAPSSQHQSPSRILQGEKREECVRWVVLLCIVAHFKFQYHDGPTKMHCYHPLQRVAGIVFTLCGHHDKTYIEVVLTNTTVQKFGVT